jgi:hypothetical protein
MIHVVYGGVNILSEILRYTIHSKCSRYLKLFQEFLLEKSQILNNGTVVMVIVQEIFDCTVLPTT